MAAYHCITEVFTTQFLPFAMFMVLQDKADKQNTQRAKQ